MRFPIHYNCNIIAFLAKPVSFPNHSQTYWLTLKLRTKICVGEGREFTGCQGVPASAQIPE